MAGPQKRRGKWRIQYFDAYGVRRSETFLKKETAEKVLRDKQTEAEKIKGGLVKPLSDKTFAEAVEEWKKGRPEKRLKDDEGRLRVHILPFFGEYRLPDITQDVLKRFIRHLETKKKIVNKPVYVDGKRTGVKPVELDRALQPMTIKNCLILVAKILSDSGYPQKIKYKVPTSGYAWIANPEDVTKFLAKCTTPWFRIAAALAVYAGLRKGEVCGLRVDAIDFERGLMRIDRSYDGPVKSKHLRWVPLAPALQKLLEPWLASCGDEFVVTMDGERVGEKTNLCSYTRRACARAEVTSVSFHQLRHTAASHLAQRVPLPLVGAVLGHADPKTTARYAHLDTQALARDKRLHLDFGEKPVIVVESVESAEQQADPSSPPSAAAPTVHPSEETRRQGTGSN
jgi:integrase